MHFAPLFLMQHNTKTEAAFVWIECEVHSYAFMKQNPFICERWRRNSQVHEAIGIKTYEQKQRNAESGGENDVKKQRKMTMAEPTWIEGYEIHATLILHSRLYLTLHQFATHTAKLCKYILLLL